MATPRKRRSRTAARPAPATAIRLSGETSVGAQVRDEPRRRVEAWAAEPQAWAAEPQAWAAEPQAWAAEPQGPAAEPLIWVSKPQSWAAEPQDDPPKANPVTDDLSRPLHEPIELGGGKQLTTLRDVEVHLLTLTPAQRTLRSWRLVEQAVTEAARGGDIREVVYAVKLARILDR